MKKKIKQVINDKELKNLKVIKYNKCENLKELNKECPIDLCKFNKDDNVIILPCNHVYKEENIIKWLKTESYKCPVCRYEFDYKEIYINDISNNYENLSNNYENLSNNYENNNINLNMENDLYLQEILLNSFNS